MTKNDIAVALCKRIPDLQKSMALSLVDNFTDILSGALASGENIYLRGFATLALRLTRAKKARNIRTGATVTVPPRRTVKFLAGKHLKDLLNNDH